MIPFGEMLKPVPVLCPAIARSGLETAFIWTTYCFSWLIDGSSSNLFDGIKKSREGRVRPGHVVRKTKPAKIKKVKKARIRIKTGLSPFSSCSWS